MCRIRLQKCKRELVGDAVQRERERESSMHARTYTQAEPKTKTWKPKQKWEREREKNKMFLPSVAAEPECHNMYYIAKLTRWKGT